VWDAHCTHACAAECALEAITGLEETNFPTYCEVLTAFIKTM